MDRKNRFTLIVAIGPDNVIGVKDKLLWHSKLDLMRFKVETLYHTCIFGVTTFNGLPTKPLPKRYNVVLDANQKEKVVVHEDEMAYVTCNNFETALKMFDNGWNKIYICGGAGVYKYALEHNIVDRIVLTRVTSNILDWRVREYDNGDLVRFPIDIDEYVKDWELVSESETQEDSEVRDEVYTLKFQEYIKNE